MTASDLAAVRGVLTRTFGDSSVRFELETLDLPGDIAEVSAHGGKVRVQGTSAIALCRGAYHYLREYCHRQVCWSGGPIDLPAQLPDCTSVRVESRVPRRHYLSVCTFGYSACWWTWERWEQELDWMALHGINQPLLLVGQEAISRRILLQLGHTEDDLAGYLSGPAYLCWHRLGNLNGHLGPLPLSWINDQERLQRKVLGRARELGMSPIVPGFSGFVPARLKQIRPELELMSAEPWAGFERTTYVDPRSETFREAGRLYLEEYHRAYGPVHHYLCEIFAEQVPCLDPVTELDDLRAIGRATWETLISVDVEANWVMQGWPFYFARDYWQPEKTEALLEAAPGGRVTVLDLATEELETWRLQPAMREKGWMFNVVHNYGQNTHLHGDLRGFVDRAETALRDPDRGRLEGFGISPEGIDQNPIVYELLADLAWDSTIDLSDRVRRYARARYGRSCAAAERAWWILAETIYGPERQPHPRYSWRFRPGDQPLVASPDMALVREALEGLLSVSGELEGSSNFRRDVVDVAKTWLGAICDRLLEQALEGGDRDPFFEALADLDQLLATRPEHRLSTWLESARACATDPSEARLYERNARSLVTHWGGPFLFDYATREWAGLTADFHAERWRRWFEGFRDFASWEKEWADSHRPPKESPPKPEIETATRLLGKYHGVAFARDLSLRVDRLEPRHLEQGSLSVDLLGAKTVHAVACCPVFGQGFCGRYSLDVSVDGETWEAIAPYHSTEETCRGTRFRFEPESVRHLRFAVERVQGSPDQQFQVVLFHVA